MKNKIIMIALVTTVSLGACTAPREHNYSAVDHKQTVYRVSGEELDRSDVRKVQKSLATEGFYRGKIDGIWGVKTSQAILDYQTVRHPGETDLTVDTLQEFGVKMDEDRYRAHHRSRHKG